MSATLIFVDETGFLLAPLLQRTQAHRGRTPILEQEGGHRHKVSVAGAIYCSPQRRRLRLFWEMFPDSYVNAEGYAAFLEDLLAEVAGPIILLQDQGPLHHGEAMEELLEDHPRLTIEEFPAYAPELNPVEFLWKHLKAEELANFAPLNLEHLIQMLHPALLTAANNQQRLQSCIDSSELAW